MAKNYKRDGETIDFTAAANLASGALVIVGANGVAAVNLNTVVSGAKGVGHTEGVWELPAVAAATAAQGDKAYATATGTVTGVATANTLIGRFWEPLTSGQTVAQVKLNVP